MHICPTCKSSFTGGEQFCPRDGTPLRSSLPEDPLAGRVLSGRYRLVEVIGRGGMGAVYRAHHTLMDKAVAVKVLRQELASDTEAVARFHREARSASRLDHEHIIRVSDFGQTDDGLLFLVMELLDGENLAEVLRRGPLPWRRAAAIARDVALGLSHAHEQGVIHRDLKPENIVLVRRGKSRQMVKVLDFGLAKLISHPRAENAADGGDGEPDVAVQSLTRTGVVFGTPEYMSPEQAEGRPLDARTDLYALGVVTYQMLAGKLPFSAPTFLALIAKTVNEAPPPLRAQNPSATVPDELEELVMSCLAKAPDDRPQGAEDIAETLDHLLATLPDENLRSGEVSIPRSGDAHPSARAVSSGGVPPLSSPSLAAAASGGADRGSEGRVERTPGGVARTVQRVLVPGQTPVATSRDRAAAGDAASAPSGPPQPSPGLGRSNGPTSLSQAFAAVSAAQRRRPAEPGRDLPAEPATGETDGSARSPDDEADPTARADQSPTDAAGRGADPASAERPNRTGPKPSSEDAPRSTGPGPRQAPPAASGSPRPPRRAGPAGPKSGAVPNPGGLQGRDASADSPVASRVSPRVDADADLAVPRRPYWWAGAALAALVGMAAIAIGLGGGTAGLLSKKPVPGIDDPLQRAARLLGDRPLLPAQVDEALRILNEQRQQQNRSEVHRLLSLAYEAQDNRLRALGHLYTARQLAGGGADAHVIDLALSQLLARLGHSREACQTALKLLALRPAPQSDVARGAQALIDTQHCPPDSAGRGDAADRHARP